MPTPSAGESEQDFVSRCIPTLIDEGKPQDQAAAICFDIFRNKISQKEAEQLIEDEAEKKWLPFYEAVTRPYELSRHGDDDRKKPRKPKKPSALSGSYGFQRSEKSAAI